MNPRLRSRRAALWLRSAAVLEIKCERRIPGPLTEEHGIADDDQFRQAGDEGEFLGFAAI